MMERRVLEHLRHPALQGRWVASISGFLPEELVIEQIGPNYMYRTGQTSRFYGGRMYDFPDVAHGDPIPITFYETHTFDMADFFYRWNMLKFEPTQGIYGVPADYLRDIVVQLFPVTSSQTPAATLTLQGVWPVDNQPFDLTYVNAEGRIVQQINFSSPRDIKFVKNN